MHTVTLKVSDDFMPKFFALLDILPKNKVKIEQASEKEAIIKKISADIKKSIKQAKNGDTIKTGRTITLNAKS